MNTNIFFPPNFHLDYRKWPAHPADLINGLTILKKQSTESIFQGFWHILTQIK